MRTHFILTLLVIGALMVPGCTAEYSASPQNAPGQTLTFEGCLADNESETRTCLVPTDYSRWMSQRDYKTLLWEPEETITVFPKGYSPAVFTSTNQGGASSVLFSGTIPEYSGTELPEVWAVYPHREDNISDGESVTITIPHEQDGVLGTFANQLFPSVARNAGDNRLSFYNVCGGVYFTFKQQGIERILIKSLGGEPLAGRVRIKFGEDGRPFIDKVIDGRDEIILTAPEGGFQNLENNERSLGYFAILLPQVLEKGFRVTLQKSDKSISTDIPVSVTVKRSVFGWVSEVDRGADFSGEHVLDPDSPAIHFADNQIKADLISKFDVNRDGELSYSEAKFVTSLQNVFTNQSRPYTSFDEFQYFTSVTAVPQGWFLANKLLTSVILPESIKTIGESAFDRCSSLTNVPLPKGLEVIGPMAFYSCQALSSPVIPETVHTIGTYAFFDCDSFESILIPDSVQSMAQNAFASCSSLKDLTIGKAFSGKTVFDVFNSCPLETVTLLPGLSILADGAFRNCKTLKTVHIPDGMTHIGGDAFSRCDLLERIELPEGVVWIGDEAFISCQGLKVADIPSSIEYLGQLTFAYCQNLTQIILRAETPPQGILAFEMTGDCPIYVPDAALDAYKRSPYWSAYAARFKPLSSLPQ